MAPVPPPPTPNKQSQTYSYLTQVNMPPPAIPAQYHQQQQHAFMAYPTMAQYPHNQGVQTVPQVQNMTLNIDHPGTYAITVNYQPCQESVQEMQRNMVRQARQMFNTFHPRRN